MTQTLLTERFKRAFHRETKEIAVYALVVAKGERRAPLEMLIVDRAEKAPVDN